MLWEAVNAYEDDSWITTDIGWAGGSGGPGKHARRDYDGTHRRRLDSLSRVDSTLLGVC